MGYIKLIKNLMSDSERLHVCEGFFLMSNTRVNIIGATHILPVCLILFNFNEVGWYTTIVDKKKSFQQPLMATKMN